MKLPPNMRLQLRGALVLTEAECCAPGEARTSSHHLAPASAAPAAQARSVRRYPYLRSLSGDRLLRLRQMAVMPIAIRIAALPSAIAAPRAVGSLNIMTVLAK
jgi:hypothetical protein